MSSKPSKTAPAQTEWDDEEEQVKDPEAVAVTVREAVARLRVLAIEVRDLYAVIGDGYKFSKTLKPMAKRYAWREEADLTSAGRDEELRMAARWASEREQIESERTIPPLSWSPRAILSAYEAWKTKQGKRKRKSGVEIRQTWDRLPPMYAIDEVEHAHPDLAKGALLAARKSAKAASGGAVDRRLVIAALQSAMDQEARAFATDISMSGGHVNVGRAVAIQQGDRRRAYEHDGDF